MDTLGNKPLISVITVCLNSVDFIGEAIESVQNQGYEPLEHVVVDGGSTDGTLAVLARYRDLRVLSEPDEGVYDAMNKGIRLARGEIIGLLNSDDLYEPNAIAEVAERFVECKDLEALAGDATIFEDEPDGTRHTVASYTGIGDGPLWPHATFGVPTHNAWFFRKSLFEHIGFYDTRYKFAADRDLLLRLELASVRHTNLGQVVYHYRQHAGSLTVSPNNPRAEAMLAEYMTVAERYLRQRGLPAEARRCLSHWHGGDAARTVKLALRGGRISDAARAVLRGWRYDVFWPVTVWSVLRSRHAVAGGSDVGGGA